MLIASTRLTQLAASLQRELVICADPTTTPGQFAHARRMAISYVRPLLREYAACESLSVIMGGWQGVTVGTSTWNEQAAWDEQSRTNPYDFGN